LPYIYLLLIGRIMVKIKINTISMGYARPKMDSLDASILFKKESKKIVDYVNYMVKTYAKEINILALTLLKKTAKTLTS
jgi:hypothetical protein